MRIIIARAAFRVNGRLVFLKGANWVPPEGATHCWRPERAMRLLDLAQHGRMNVLRVWGEGHVPPQAFYDACDRPRGHRSGRQRRRA